MARYYNKADRNEHVEIIHGPWQDNPDVIDLDLGNVFWGEPLDSDMMLTYDVDNIPVSVVPRPVPEGNVIYGLLQDAGLTSRTLRQAQLADSRGSPTPLADFNAALTALISSHPYTEAQFLEQL
jgi:hypothetical protein